jgi:hypothetical protein
VVVEADAVANVEHRERFGGADRLQQVDARVDRVGDRVQVRVQLAGGDLVKQKPLWLRLALLRVVCWPGRRQPG